MLKKDWVRGLCRLEFLENRIFVSISVLVCVLSSLTPPPLSHCRPRSQQDVCWGPFMADNPWETAGVLWFLRHCAGCAHHEGPRDTGELVSCCQSPQLLLSPFVLPSSSIIIHLAIFWEVCVKGMVVEENAWGYNALTFIHVPPPSFVMYPLLILLFLDDISYTFYNYCSCEREDKFMKDYYYSYYFVYTVVNYHAANISLGP